MEIQNSKRKNGKGNQESSMVAAIFRQYLCLLEEKFYLLKNEKCQNFYVRRYLVSLINDIL